MEKKKRLADDGDDDDFVEGDRGVKLIAVKNGIGYLHSNP